jgi:predicted lipid-binding transport protein (Tim44 family)
LKASQKHRVKKRGSEEEAAMMMECMSMEGMGWMMGGMMGGIAIVWILFVILLVLASAALVKFLRR